MNLFFRNIDILRTKQKRIYLRLNRLGTLAHIEIYSIKIRPLKLFWNGKKWWLSKYDIFIFAFVFFCLIGIDFMHRDVKTIT